MATKNIKMAEGGGIRVEGVESGGELVRAASLNDTRENAYTAAVGCDGYTLYIFEHKRAVVKEFRRRLESLAETGVELQNRPYPVLSEGPTPEQEKAWQEVMQAEAKARAQESEALQAEMEAIFAEVNACVRGWDLPDENGVATKRRVDYAAEVEAENIAASMVPTIFARIWGKHNLEADERQQPRR